MEANPLTFDRHHRHVIINLIIIINMITIMMFIVRYGELGVVEVPNCNGTNLLSRPNLRLRLILIMMIIVKASSYSLLLLFRMMTRMDL